MANKKVQPKKAVVKQVDLEESINEVVTAVEPTETTKDWQSVKPTDPVKPEWEIKDRIYYLSGTSTPLTLTIPGKHTRKHALLYFDEKTKKQKEIRYATNHDSPFKEEQEGEATMGHIMFRDGDLRVPKEKQNLQKLLSLYHPRKEYVFTEFSKEVIAVDELEEINLELDAMNAAKAMDVDQAEAILRVDKGTAVGEMTSKEIKRDLLLMAKKSPKAFMAIANDENVGLRNVAIKAVEQQVVKLSQDQRTFHWGSNDRKLMTVPFDENPYSAMAAWFKTDEGVEVFKTIEKKLQ